MPHVLDLNDIKNIVEIHSSNMMNLQHSISKATVTQFKQLS